MTHPDPTLSPGVTFALPPNPAGTALPGPAFFLFGAGARRKLVYRDGVLEDALTGETLRRWDVWRAEIDAAGGAVRLETPRGPVHLVEDEEGVWLDGAGGREALTLGPVRLPRFDGHPFAPLLRALHRELLVNVVGGAPLPNLFVYRRPWYRDAAMVAMALDRTGNLGLLEGWIQSLREVYDRNNAGHEESDNLGQVLYLVSLVGDARHPVVESVLREASTRREGRALTGLSDFAPHPVYQTKWLKFGLARLGLDDDFVIPGVPDAYSSLFWMAYRDEHVPHGRFGPAFAELYPYLSWAEAHFLGEAPPLHLAGRAFPLTWEARASEADYGALTRLDPGLAARRLSPTHTWHAAEMLLYLLDLPVPPGEAR
ncbi:hypothetical protein DAETH_36160 (plasmid) [Deinococcus aetherius]|uniref:Uncharacterized protein n=1 Tax=Deinococcus aetherius TaxID=200252 RepID=A0ABN6RJX4_9DEIO|nr:hypothetical protein [Deinococcus aetherius]BDP43647.1 hypothetical protein DAETH_36160 [Deinococcus aetherius]